VSATVCSESSYKEMRSEEENRMKRTSEVVLINVHVEKKCLSENMWIADCGIARHVTNSLEGLYNIREVTESLKFS